MNLLALCRRFQLRVIAASLAGPHTLVGTQAQPVALAHRNDVPVALVAKAGALVNADAKRLLEIFKDIHQNPELGFMETRTAAIVAKELSSLG